MVEFRIGEDGHPYAVEFSNVSIWPRRPEALSKPAERSAASPRVKHKPVRSQTMPSPMAAMTIQKPLPSLPEEGPTRTGSLRRVFRRRFSEPGRHLQIHNDWLSAVSPGEGRANINARLEAEGNEHLRDSIAALTLVPEDEPQEESQEVLPAVEVPTRVRSLRRRPPISVLDHISSVIPEASPMLIVPPHKRHHPESPDELNIRSGGLHLSFPSGESAGLQLKTPTSRLRRLSRTIARAVANAGMLSPHANSDGNGDPLSAPGGKSLYRGTYGQVRNALHAAGLVVKKCEEEGFDGASRVGTLFVANRDVHDNVIFTKVVLYGTC